MRKTTRLKKPQVPELEQLYLFDELGGRPKYGNEEMTSETDIPSFDSIMDETHSAVVAETSARVLADRALQNEIDTIKAASDVVDIVGTYADLQAYDTSKLNDNDIIKVLEDETHDDAVSYYRWAKASSQFNYIGSQGPYQDKLIAGSNIQIASDGKTISATDTTYTAGTNVQINGTTISATDTTYSNFVGTDGTTAGTAGLVPAPATTDAGKVLSADGGWVDNDNFYDVKVSTRTDKTYRELKTAWEAGKVLRFGSQMGVFWFWQKGNGSTDTFPITFAAKKHNLYTLQGEVAYNGTGVPAVIKLELYMSSTASDWRDQTLSSSADPIANLQPAGLDATTPDYKIPSITVLKNALAEKEPVTIVNAGAPTTSTAAVGVGQQYYDSTNNKLYYCSAITAQGTDPETYTYTWSSFGPNVVQTTGTSTTDVMSQDATTNMLWRDPTTKRTIQYNTWSNSGSSHGTDLDNIYIGKSINAREGSCGNNILIGHYTKTSGQSGNSIVIGNHGDAFSDDVVSIGNQDSAFGISKQGGALSIGQNIGSVPANSVLIGNKSQSYGVNAPSSTASDTIAIGADTTVAARGAVAIGRYASATSQGEFNISLANKTDPSSTGYNGSSYRLLTGLAMPTDERDAASKGYVDSNTPTTFTTNEWNALWA